MLAAIALGAYALPASANSARNLGEGAHECLSRIVYHEARGESERGQKAVAEVVINRARSAGFPSTVCGVVRQRGQFTSIGGAIRERGAYEEAKEIAEMAIDGKTGNLTKGATYFHTPSVRPDWSRKFTRVAQIENHIFYSPKR